MKKFLWASLLLLCLPSLTWAGSGSAMINKFAISSAADSWVYITNISGQAVNVKVTLYDWEGNIYSGPFYFDRAFTLNPVAGPVSLGSKKMGRLGIMRVNGQDLDGYGIIEWESSSNDMVALMAHAHTHYDSGDHAVVAPVNGGQPF